ncbi:hypothetical protein GW7_11270 [Heterocephalus glaber]|uniref:Uncharacterized protein n=1 Tax=Heterocephalus glaber TaxID=10181 RepID=G5BPB7_HETGA|nr:hypothetical protein GW7_11270 [Heterocephalus glaber]
MLRGFEVLADNRPTRTDFNPNPVTAMSPAQGQHHYCLAVAQKFRTGQHRPRGSGSEEAIGSAPAKGSTPKPAPWYLQGTGGSEAHSSPRSTQGEGEMGGIWGHPEPVWLPLLQVGTGPR